MAITTSTALLEEFQKYQLLTPEQHQEIARHLLLRFRSIPELTKFLLAQRWLSAYQIDTAIAGKAKELIAGPYRIQEKLGTGATAQVYKALDTRTGRVAALKVINPKVLADAEALGRFQREAQILYHLNHPNIVQFFDAGRLENTLYLAMEFVQGTDLQKMVMASPLRVPQACEYVYQTTQGLQHAHEKGLVHRDIKPGNLFLTVPARVIKIVDLGLARVQKGPGDAGNVQGLTTKGTMLGTADYLAPEQARDATAVDIRADLYSLGCTLYHFLTGRVPFPDPSVLKKLLAHAKQEPTPVEDLRKEVSPELGAVVRKLMAKRPEDRYQTPAEAGKALEPFRPPPGATSGGFPKLG